MTWTENIEPLAGGSTQKLTFASGDRVMTVREFYETLASDSEFCEKLSALLISFGYQAIRWETPVMTKATLDEQFECVVLSSPGLDRPASQQAFAEFFAKDWPQNIAVFENLSGDATLVVPCPEGSDTAYCHLASFLRDATMHQRQALWSKLAKTVLEQVTDKTLWVNTAGGGVPWLHLRLDSRPKYYHHKPYKESTLGGGYNWRIMKFKNK